MIKGRRKSWSDNRQRGWRAVAEKLGSSVVLTDPKIRKQILDYLESKQVKKVILTEGNIGCPHEEGKDYPNGESCHFCGFWKKK